MLYILLFFFKQKTAYEMRSSDWSSDVCSSDLLTICLCALAAATAAQARATAAEVAVVGAESALGYASAIALGKGNVVAVHNTQIGRASCRERVCQYV